MSLFQNEAKYEGIDVKMIFCSHADKTYFHEKRFRSQLHFKSENVNGSVGDTITVV